MAAESLFLKSWVSSLASAPHAGAFLLQKSWGQNSACLAASKMLCTHDGIWKYIIMLKATSRQHYQGKAFPSHSSLVYLFLSRCQNLASSTERLSFALMLGRHPVPACLLSLPVSTGTPYTRLPAHQEMLSLLPIPPPLPPPAGESPVLGLLQDPGVRQSRSYSL